MAGRAKSKRMATPGSGNCGVIGGGAVVDSAAAVDAAIASLDTAFQTLAKSVDVFANPHQRGLPGGSPASIPLRETGVTAGTTVVVRESSDDWDHIVEGEPDHKMVAALSEQESNCNRQQAFFKDNTASITSTTPTPLTATSTTTTTATATTTATSKDGQNTQQSPSGVKTSSGIDFLKEAQLALKAGQYERVQCLISLHAPTVAPEATLKAWYTVRYGLAVRLKHYDTALLWIQKCLELNPLDVEVYNFMGMVNLQRKDYNQAKVCFNAALALSPSNDVAKSGLGAVEKSLTK